MKTYDNLLKSGRKGARISEFLGLQQKSIGVLTMALLIKMGAKIVAISIFICHYDTVRKSEISISHAMSLSLHR